jgi:fumarate hydratase class II
VADTPRVPDVPPARIEHDSLGEVTVPAGALWGPQTQRAVENFPISGGRMPAELIHALASLKGVSASVNGRLRVIPKDVAAAIHEAASEMSFGVYDEQFPVDVFQTGSGTSTNMNVNEVLARVAAERLGRPVHANDHVNASQSSNDVFPSAVRLAACRVIVRRVVPALDHLHAELRRLARTHARTVKAGRTHLMDAAPVTFGQELAGWARQVELGKARLLDVLPRLGELPLGGTAVGTGLNAPPRFARAVIAALAADMGLPLSEAVDHFEAQSAQDALVEASGAAKVLALSLHKMAGDLRLMGSGPATGLAEVTLPSLQPGSSIMPGKVNPVIPEVVNQIAFEVIGNDITVTMAAEGGQLQLNAFEPVIAHSLFKSISHLAAGCRTLGERCVRGITANRERARRLLDDSTALVTALNPYIGYARSSEIAKEALATGRRVYDLVLERGLMTRADLDALLKPEVLTQPHFSTVHRPKVEP